MNAAKANLINAITLIIMPLWGYFSSLTPSITALIPMVFGIVLLSLNNGIKLENKAQAHAAVALTLIVLISLIKPLSGAMDRSDNMAIFRVGIMIFTGLLSTFYLLIISSPFI